MERILNLVGKFIQPYTALTKGCMDFIDFYTAYTALKIYRLYKKVLCLHGFIQPIQPYTTFSL